MIFNKKLNTFINRKIAGREILCKAKKIFGWFYVIRKITFLNLNLPGNQVSLTRLLELKEIFKWIFKYFSNVIAVFGAIFCEFQSNLFCHKIFPHLTALNFKGRPILSLNFAIGDEKWVENPDTSWVSFTKCEWKFVKKSRAFLYQDSPFVPMNSVFYNFFRADMTPLIIKV